MAVILGLLVVTAASCRPRLAQAPMEPSGEFSAPVAIVPEGMSDDVAKPFVLMPGDVVHLQVASVDPVDLPNLAVDAVGRIAVPFVGGVPVQGLSLFDASRLVEKECRRHDRFARATISLTKAAGHSATIIGAVHKPGVYVIRPGSRIADLVAEAGGLKSQTMNSSPELINLADADGSRLMRDGEPLQISVTQALMGAPDHNVFVQSQDLLYVPPSRGAMITVLGSVNNATTMPFVAGMRLTAALAQAGGANKDADNADIRVIRGPLSKPQVYRANLRALAAGRATDVVLARGDVIYVTEDSFVTVTDVLDRLSPLLTASALAATVLQTSK